MADPSFDIVSKVDRQEVDNALNQASKEVGQRYDFRGTDASIGWSGDEAILVKANSEDRAKAVLEVFKEKLIKRQVSLKSIDPGEPAQSGKEYRLTIAIRQGLADEKAKEIAKLIRTEGPRGVQPQIQGDQLRVSGKKKDDLQAVMTLLRETDLDVALQFTNYR